MSREQRDERGDAGSQPAGWLRHAWEQTHTLLIAVLIALGIRAFLVEPFRIPSGSMLPNLLIGDHLFVNKFVYGAKIPLVNVRLPALREPERGDVVVFTVARQGGEIHPADRRPELRREEFVKRIVGVPGDVIEVRDGQVVLNGQPVEHVSLGRSFEDESGRALSMLKERLDGTEHVVLDDPRLSGLSRSRFTVEPGRYFFMGDNRDHSNDSRRWGTVSIENLKGPAFVLYWSWNYNGGWLGLLSPLTWWHLLTEETRWDRIGEPIR